MKIILRFFEILKIRELFSIILLMFLAGYFISLVISFWIYITLRERIFRKNIQK